MSEKEMESEEKPITAKDFKVPLPPVRHYLSTGCTLLDLAISDRLPGGFPSGRIVQIYGGESSAKTVLGSEAMGSAHRQGGKAEMDDIEGSWDPRRSANLHDVKVSTDAWGNAKDSSVFRLRVSSSIENLFDEKIDKMIKWCAKTTAPCCRTIDSLSALASEKELEESMSAATMGMTRAKQLSLAFRKYIGPIAKSGIAMLFIDQTRENVGVSFGESDTTPGGRALKFYASVRVRLQHLERLKNSAGKVIGVKLGFFTRKNKVAPPFREGSFHVIFDYGIDDIASSVDWLHDNDPAIKAEFEAIKKAAKTDDTIIVPKKAPWMVTGLGLRAGNLNALCNKIEDQGLEKELAQEVERVWRIVYAPINRKKRVRIGN